jgi:hypothetical protein
MEALGKPFATAANTQLLQGISLTLHEPIFKDLGRTRLFVYDHFLMVEADPSF